MAFETPHTRTVTGNTASWDNSQYWRRGKAPVGPTLLAEASGDDITPVQGPPPNMRAKISTPDAGTPPDEDKVAPRRPVRTAAPQEFQDQGATVTGDPAANRRVADRRTRGNCDNFQYNDQGTLADDPVISKWRANSTPDSPLTKSWTAAHKDQMTKPINGNSYEAQWGDDLDGIVVRWMRSHNKSMDQFAEKKAEVIRLNQDHYQTLKTNPDFIGYSKKSGHGWKLKLADCDDAPASPAPIEPPTRPRRQAAVEPPPSDQDYVEPRRPRVAQVRPPEQDYAPPDRDYVPVRRPDCFPCDGGRLEASNPYGNMTINGVVVGPGTAEVMVDGRVRYHNRREEPWQEAGQSFAAVIPQVMPQIFSGRPFMEPGVEEWRRREWYRRHQQEEWAERDADMDRWRWRRSQGWNTGDDDDWRDRERRREWRERQQYAGPIGGIWNRFPQARAVYENNDQLFGVY